MIGNFFKKYFLFYFIFGLFLFFNINFVLAARPNKVPTSDTLSGFGSSDPNTDGSYLYFNDTNKYLQFFDAGSGVNINNYLNLKVDSSGNFLISTLINNKLTFVSGGLEVMRIENDTTTNGKSLVVNGNNASNIYKNTLYVVGDVAFDLSGGQKMYRNGVEVGNYFIESPSNNIRINLINPLTEGIKIGAIATTPNNNPSYINIDGKTLFLKQVSMGSSGAGVNCSNQLADNDGCFNRSIGQARIFSNDDTIGSNNSTSSSLFDNESGSCKSFKDGINSGQKIVMKLSKASVLWEGARSACPSGWWVCKKSERSGVACKSSLPSNRNTDTIDKVQIASPFNCEPYVSGKIFPIDGRDIIGTTSYLKDIGWTLGWVAEPIASTTVGSYLPQVMSNTDGINYERTFHSCASMHVWCCGVDES